MQITQIGQIKRNIRNKSNDARNAGRANSGYTLIEMAVGLILSIIIVYIAASLYTQTVNIHRRQQRVISIERALLDTHLSLEQSLTSLTGRNLGVFTGDYFSIPLLPSAGTAINFNSGKNEPIRLGIVTPYMLNDQPAFTVVYSDAAIPRLELAETSSVGLANTGTLKISTKSISNSSLFSSPTKTDSITNNPPNVPSDTTLSGLPYIANPKMFQVGQLMLLAGSPPSKVASNKVLSQARLIKINSVTTSNSFIQLSYDLCVNDCEGEITGLKNFSDAPMIFSVGSLLVPVKIASFYITKDSINSRLVRNDNGLILPVGEHFKIKGGKETILGEADSITVNYKLEDGSIQPTPSSPIVPWLNNITSLDVRITKSMPGVQGTEILSRSTDINFPILVRNTN